MYIHIYIYTYIHIYIYTYIYIYIHIYQACRQELAEQWREVEALRNRNHELTFQADGQENRLDTAQEDLTASRVSLRSLQKEFCALQQENAMLREAADSAASKEHVASKGLLAVQDGTVYQKSPI